MKKEQHVHIKQKLSSLLMLLMLAWLTVCLPCVTESSQNIKNLVQITGEETPASDDSNPLTNTNEEKSESGGSLLSEYLHHLFQIEHTFTNIASFYKFHPSDLYLAYHPKLIIPPPEL